MRRRASLRARADPHEPHGAHRSPMCRHSSSASRWVAVWPVPLHCTLSCARGLQVKVGVLALQGAFAAHARALRALGADPHEVRRPADLDRADALILPGGESTTMSMLLDSSGL